MHIYNSLPSLKKQTKKELVVLRAALIFYGGNHEAFQVVTSEKAFWVLLADMAS